MAADQPDLHARRHRSRPRRSAAEGLEDLPGRVPARRVAAGHRARRSSRSSRSVHGGNYQQCWGQPWTDTATPIPKLGPWECAAAPWFMNAAQLDKVWVASGPKSWKHIDIKQLAHTTETPIAPTQVTDIHEDVDTISFHVSEIGKPVLGASTSYFPNWQAHGATGPYRVAPNLMVVVPTSHDVKLTYGLTTVDWLGRIGTLLGSARLGGAVRAGRAAPALRGGDARDDRRRRRRPDGDGGRRRRDAERRRRRDRRRRRPTPVGPAPSTGPPDGEPPDRSSAEPALP